MCVCACVCVVCANTRDTEKVCKCINLCVQYVHVGVDDMYPTFLAKGILCSVCVLVCSCVCVCVQQSRSISVVCRETAVPSATVRYGGVSPAVSACYI